MTALICGSLAYDTVMVFEGRFREHILPDRIHMLNVSFLAPSMRRNFGGCAGNIAYNLKLLGGEGLIMATVGHDFAPYERWLAERGIALTHVRKVTERIHRAGLHHHRSGRQPDHRLSSRGDEPCASQPASPPRRA